MELGVKDRERGYVAAYTERVYAIALFILIGCLIEVILYPLNLVNQGDYGAVLFIFSLIGSVDIILLFIHQTKAVYLSFTGFVYFVAIFYFTFPSWCMAAGENVFWQGFIIPGLTFLGTAVYLTFKYSDVFVSIEP